MMLERVIHTVSEQLAMQVEGNANLLELYAWPSGLARPLRRRVFARCHEISHYQINHLPVSQDMAKFERGLRTGIDRQKSHSGQVNLSILYEEQFNLIYAFLPPKVAYIAQLKAIHEFAERRLAPEGKLALVVPGRKNAMARLVGQQIESDNRGREIRCTLTDAHVAEFAASLPDYHRAVVYDVEICSPGTFEWLAGRFKPIGRIARLVDETKRVTGLDVISPMYVMAMLEDGCGEHGRVHLPMEVSIHLYGRNLRNSDYMPEELAA